MLDFIVEQLAIDLLLSTLRSFLRSGVERASAPARQRTRLGGNVAAPQTTVVSLIPGRVRFRVIAIRGDHHLARELAIYMSRQPGIHYVEANETTGSFLARYQPDEIDVATIWKALDAFETPGYSRPNNAWAAGGRTARPYGSQRIRHCGPSPTWAFPRGRRSNPAVLPSSAR